MSRKTKVILMVMISCLIICSAVTLFLPLETKMERIEPPFEDMYWGMTLDEAKLLLKEAGISEVELGEESDPYRVVERWMLTSEQAQRLGYISPGSLEISTEREWPVYVGFCSSTSDKTPRLVTVSIMIQVPDEYAATKKEYVRVCLSEIYGPTFENWDLSYWALGVEDVSKPAYSPNLSAVIDRRTTGRNVLLCYDGNGYLSRLEDSENAYRDVSGDMGIVDVIDIPS